MIEIKVPTVGESISEVTLVKWLKADGDYVERDELLCELESEKATFELNAEQAGILHIVAKENETLAIGAIACTIDETAAKPAGKAVEKKEEKTPEKAAKALAKPVAEKQEKPSELIPDKSLKASPVAKAIIADKHLENAAMKGTGSGGRILKQDVLEALSHPPGSKTNADGIPSREARNVNMSNLRKTVSRRLVEAKNSTAMLTTFNEVDMSGIMATRAKFKDKFKEQHGVGLGFMSFFTRACCIALSEWQAVNASIEGDQIVYHDYCDISIAVSGPKGLVVPVIRNAESLSMAGIEQEVVNLATKARENKLSIDEMSGGTFTITNGGVFGSLLSTPIINLPQSAILGMHKIEERPIALNGQVVIRPMMYLALSYDHRIIDGRESVGFLVRVKELLESPDMLLAAKEPVKLLLGL